MNDEKEAIGALLDTYLAGGGDLFDPFAAKDPAPTGTSTSTTVTGEAAESMTGPVVVVNGEAILVTGFSSWPEGVAGKQVRVTGNTGSASAGSAPSVGADGAVSHGASGSIDMLTDAQWELVD